VKRFKKKRTFFIVLLITILLALVAVFGLEIGGLDLKGAGEMRFGIDIRGGVEATYEPKDLDRSPTAAELEAARASLKRAWTP
jgi:preprotein translocase subunit SecD